MNAAEKILSAHLKSINSEGRSSLHSWPVSDAPTHIIQTHKALLPLPSNYGGLAFWTMFRCKSSAWITAPSNPLHAGSAHWQKCFASIYCRHGEWYKMYKRKCFVCLKGWFYIKVFAVITMLQEQQQPFSMSYGISFSLGDVFSKE